MACKPGSVPLRAMTIHLGRPLPDASSNQPGRRPGNGCSGRDLRCRPYSVLLPVGFALPRPLPTARCALTAPFHPYPAHGPGGLLSVALSLESPPPDVIRHRVSVEPGLSSTQAETRAAAIRPSDPLDMRLKPRCVKMLALYPRSHDIGDTANHTEGERDESCRLLRERATQRFQI